MTRAARSHAPAGARRAARSRAAAALAVIGILAPTVPLARHLFCEPTSAYKTGIVFLAWLGGHQEAFRMVGGMESARSPEHLRTAYELALDAGLLPDPELAGARMGRMTRAARSHAWAGARPAARSRAAWQGGAG